MTTSKRMALLAIVVVVAVVGFIILKPDSTSKKSATDAGTSTPTTAATPSASPGKTTSKPAPPPVVQVTVKNGKPVGGIKDIEVNKGDRVRFAITSDVADEIHVHGYDFMKDVKAGGTVSFSFPAKIDGEFEVELENRAEQIISLVVQP